MRQALRAAAIQFAVRFGTVEARVITRSDDDAIMIANIVALVFSGTATPLFCSEGGRRYLFVCGLFA